MSDISASASIEIDLSPTRQSAAQLAGQVEEAIVDGAENANLSKTLVGQIKEVRGKLRDALEESLDGVELDKISFSERAKKSLEVQAKAIDALIEADLTVDAAELRQVERLIKNTFDNFELKPEVQPEVDRASQSRVRGTLRRLSEPVRTRIEADWDEAKARSARGNLARLATAVSVPIVVAVTRGPLRSAVNLIDRTFLGLARRIGQRFSTVIADSIIAGGFQRVTGFFADAFRRGIDDEDIPGQLQAKFGLTESVAEQAGVLAGQLYNDGFNRSQGELGDLTGALAQAFGGSLEGITADQISGLAGLQDAFDVDTEDIQEQIRSLTREGYSNEEAINAIAQAYSEMGRTATEILNNPEELNELINIDSAKGRDALQQFSDQAEKSLGNQFRGLLRRGQDALVGFIAPLFPTFLAAGEVVTDFVETKIAPALADLAGKIAEFFNSDQFASIVATVQDVFDRVRAVFETGEVSGEGGFIGVIEEIAQFLRVDLVDAFNAARDSLGNLKDFFFDTSEAVDGSERSFSLFRTALDLLGGLLEFVAANLEIIVPLILLYKTYQLLAWAATIAQTVALGAYNIAVGITVGLSQAWAAAQAVLNAVMSANPIALVVIAIAALVAIFVVAYKNSETFRNIVNAIWEAIKNVASVIWEFVQGALSALSNWFNDNRETFSNLFQRFVDSLNVVKAVVLFVIENVIIPYFKLLKSNAERVFGAIRFVVTGIIIPAFESFRDKVREVFEFFRDIIQGARDKFNEFRDKIKSAVTTIKQQFEKLIKPIKDVYNWIKDLINLIPSLSFSNIPGLGALADLPFFAEGGIVDRATVAVIGEAGREAVIPLTNPLRALELLRQSGLDRLILANQKDRTSDGSAAGNTKISNTTTNNVTNNISVATRPGQDNDNIGRSLLRELAVS